MRKLKHFIGKIFTGLTGRIIVSPNNIGTKFEQVQLARIFASFHVDCVFDVGANEGQYGRMLRDNVGYTGPIISFEPGPVAAEVLRREAAKEKNWYVEEMALGTEAGSVAFNVMADSQFSSLLAPSEFSADLFSDKNVVSEQVTVNASTLAIQMARYKQKLGYKNAFLKTDTQGHDLAVVAGAGLALHEFVGLQSELAVRKLYQKSPSFIEAINYYVSKGFELSAFVPNNNGHFPYLIEIDCIMLRADLIAAFVRSLS